MTTLLPAQIDVTNDKGGETFRRFDAKPGDLWMGDWGYANPPGIAAITAFAMADFVVVFTTIPKDRLSDERCLKLYSLRWQVELHIKRDKSIAGLDELPNSREDTVHSWICAKILLTQIHALAAVRPAIACYGVTVMTPDSPMPPGPPWTGQ